METIFLRFSVDHDDSRNCYVRLDSIKAFGELLTGGCWIEIGVDEEVHTTESIEEVAKKIQEAL